MVKTRIYQTLEDRENPDEIEQDGPFPGDNKEAWLGWGYYFWEHDIQLAHKWGEKCYFGNYIICEAECIIDNTCWDLHNNPYHRDEFKEIVEEMKKQPSSPKNIRVPMVIEYLKKYSSFEYKAIRVRGDDSFTEKDNKFQFENRLPATFDASPAIQICLISKKSLSFCCYKVIFPDYYREDYVI